MSTATHAATCAACGHSAAEDWTYCTRCGASLTPIRTSASDAGDVAEPGPRGLASARGRIVPRADGQTRRRRRRQRRAWYRRPVPVALLTLLLLVGTLGAAATWRATDTVSTLQRVSTPPDEVAIALEPEDLAGVPGADPGATVSVDTAPARLAVAQSGIAVGGGGAGERIRSVGDLGRGIAVSAGVADGGIEPMTILVMGVDARPGEAIDVGVRPDAIMLVRLNPETGGCRVLSIPRDTRVDLPGYGLSKINHALAVGGIPYELLVVQQALGISIDHYALMNFEGFRELVDAVGGITLDIPDDIEGNGLDLTAGRQEVDGTKALAYAQYRTYDTDGDIGRVYRQWAVLQALGEAAADRGLASDVTSLLPAVEDHIRTDLSTADFAAIGRQFGASCTVETVESEVLVGKRQRLTDPIFKQRLYYNVVDQAAIDKKVAFLLAV